MKNCDENNEQMTDINSEECLEIEKSSKQKKNGDLFDWVQCIVGALVCTILVFVFCGRIIGVEGSSMYPTLHDGDKVIMSNLFYKPTVGDIVILTKFSFDDKPIVKRIIAVENQTVDIRDGYVYVDGNRLDEDYLPTGVLTYELDIDFPVTVPEGHVLVMGDNRGASTDSRSSRIGVVDERYILGRVYNIVLPLNRIGLVK